MSIESALKCLRPTASDCHCKDDIAAEVLRLREKLAEAEKLVCCHQHLSSDKEDPDVQLMRERAEVSEARCAELEERLKIKGNLLVDEENKACRESLRADDLQSRLASLTAPVEEKEVEAAGRCTCECTTKDCPDVLYRALRQSRAALVATKVCLAGADAGKSGLIQELSKKLKAACERDIRNIGISAENAKYRDEYQRLWHVQAAEAETLAARLESAERVVEAASTVTTCHELNMALAAHSQTISKESACDCAPGETGECYQCQMRSK